MFNLYGFGKTGLTRRRKAVLPRIDGLSRVECLEERLVLASQIGVAFSGGNLILSGSAGDDNVTVIVADTNVVTLSSTGGGTFTGTIAASYTVTGTLSINMNAGDDTVTLSGAAGTYTGSKLSVDLGVGNDTLNTSGVLTLNKELTVLGGAGTDAVNLGTTVGANFVVLGISRIDTGDNDDTVTLGTTGTTALHGQVVITLGGGNDTLTIGNNAGSAAFGTANNYNFNGGGSAGDRFLGSTISLGSYQGGAMTLKGNAKLASKITGFKLFV